MITNPNAKRILCFGDSNTKGQIPSSYGRLSVNERWTGLLQNMLGSNFEIIEEGLGGRTVDIAHGSKNGTAYLTPCIDTHLPLDLVVIMLGTNDLKIKFDRTVDEIVGGLKEMIDTVQARNVPVFLVAPIILNHKAQGWTFFGEASFDERSEDKSRQLVTGLKKLAYELGCAFVAASDIVQPGSDGVHMDTEAHRLFAEMMAKRIKVLL